MKIHTALLISALAWFGLSTPQSAESASQAGGLPGITDRLDTLESGVTSRLDTLETAVAEQGTTGAALQVTVDDLQNQLVSVQNDIQAIERHLPLFAVVDSDGTLRASRSVVSAGHSLDSSNHPITGLYRVVFDRDVWLCAATVTAEPLFSGTIAASINGTFRGVFNPNQEFSPNVLHITVFDNDGNFVNARFNIIVTC